MRKTSVQALVGFLGLVSAAAACSASSDARFRGTTSGVGGNDGAGGDSATSSGSFEPGVGGGGGSTGSADACDGAPSDDSDKDGFSANEGDCNDCDPNVNPGALEVPTDPKDPKAKQSDENCDGKVDEVTQPCDAGLQLSDLDAMNGARAIGICKALKQGEKGWGVMSAAYTRANGTPASPGAAAGLLAKFGANVKPREGGTLLALSSGNARDASMAGACGSQTCYTSGPGTAPMGFPQDVPGCSGDTDINDDVALSLKLKTPSNATGYSFDFDFYSFEYPEWVCTSFNDQFIALVNPPPMGSINGNISFDSKKNPVSVNIAFFQVCGGCALGEQELLGTGFDSWDDAGATSWLTTQAPVKGGDTIDLRFAIWDTGDQAWDSTVLVDNFKWIATPGMTVSVNTVPTPK